MANSRDNAPHSNQLSRGTASAHCYHPDELRSHLNDRVQDLCSHGHLHFYDFLLLGFGLPAFSSVEAAAVRCVARLVALLWGPGWGWQLPLVRGCLPGVGSKPGQQGFFAVDFFVVVMFLLEANCGDCVDVLWRFDAEKKP
jgi:hypothetical protein